jgi:hypothetical protein
MTPAEMYDYDLKGYLLLEDAIQPNDLASLQERMAFWEAQARKELEKNPRPENPSVMVSDIVNKDPAFVDLITNPEVLSYIDAMVDHPRLKSTWIAYKWKGGWARDRSNHTPTRTTNSYSGDGLYDKLFEKALERSWLKYLLRRPHGFKETYPRPEGRAYTEG